MTFKSDTDKELYNQYVPYQFRLRLQNISFCFLSPFWNSSAYRRQYDENNLHPHESTGKTTNAVVHMPAAASEIL